MGSADAASRVSGAQAYGVQLERSDIQHCNAVLVCRTICIPSPFIIGGREQFQDSEALGQNRRLDGCHGFVTLTFLPSLLNNTHVVSHLTGETFADSPW